MVIKSYVTDSSDRVVSKRVEFTAWKRVREKKPYRYMRNINDYVECSGKYKISYVKQLERMGLIQFR